MKWREAFLIQAASDFEVLNRLDHQSVERSHRLHYLQMVTEKLAKGAMTDPKAATAPAPTHAAFVRMLRILKRRPDVRRKLGYVDTAAFNRYIDSLLDLARRIEQLAPAISGFALPNPEYPWRAPRSTDVIAPCRFTFSDFDPGTPQMQKMMELIRQLLWIAG